MSAMTWCSPVVAGELRIGSAGAVSAIDPMFHFILPNDNVSRQIFDQLILRDEKYQLKPSLALDWYPLSDTVWEFRLRPGVKFHDGTPLTAADIVFSIERAARIVTSPGSYAPYTRTIKRIVEVDADKLQFHTYAPDPLLPENLSVIHIQSREAASGKATRDFNSGEAAFGTGPYRFVEWVSGRHVVLERNKNYWGEAPYWNRVTILPKTNPSARVAGLLAGDVDIINAVPPTDMERLQNNPDISVVTSITNRVMYLQLDHRDKAPYAFDNNGVRLEKNPFLDRRVRLAISKAINRQLIVDKIMEGRGVATDQMVPPHFPGVISKPSVTLYDPKAAKELLTTAGYPEGFRLTLHTSKDRYLNADKVVLAIAQMLARVGIKVDIELQPHAVFRTRGKRLELSFQWGSWQSINTPEVLRNILATYDAKQRLGVVNRGRYSNPELDRLLLQGLQTMDEAQRFQLFQTAYDIVLEDVAVIPVYFEVDAWAMRKGLCFMANAQQELLAQYVEPCANDVYVSMP